MQRDCGTLLVMARLRMKPLQPNDGHGGPTGPVAPVAPVVPVGCAADGAAEEAVVARVGSGDDKMSLAIYISQTKPERR